MRLICHKCGAENEESLWKISRKSCTCPSCVHVIEYYDMENPPTIPDEFRKQIVDRFFKEATPGECLFQFYWSHRFEYGYESQQELF
jgi:hypothetical protein